MLPEARAQSRARLFRSPVLIGSLAVTGGCLFAQTPGQVPHENWPGYGGSSAELHYSSLDTINSQTVGRLKPAWGKDLDVPRANSEPIAVDGVIYLAAALSVVQAFDVQTGRRLWRFDPEIGEKAGIKLRAAWGVRGLAYWQGKLYVGAQDGQLIAIDAKSGKPIWSVQTTEGPDDGRSITGAPRVFNGNVIIGHGGADFASVRGYVTCYDAITGKRRWRFYTVPGNPKLGFEDKAQEMASKTWTGEWWRYGGGGTVWNAITYDADLNRLYLGTGNGSPWNWKVRNPGGGDALFLASIVALDANTGKYVWHYQENPNEAWDYNSTMDIELATLLIEGKPRKVLMHAPKNGFFYVIDRMTGRLISAEKLGKVTWANHISLETGRPVEAANIRYENGSSDIWPGNIGLHNWPPMSFNPGTQLVYIPTVESGIRASDEAISASTWKPVPGNWNTALGPIYGGAFVPSARASLLAWDPVRQQKVWEVTTPPPWNGGTLTTAGSLVFQGQIDGFFNAYDAKTGKKLWSYFAGNAVLGAPIAYSFRGKQYVSVVSAPPNGAIVQLPGANSYGWSYRRHPARLLTFVLDGRGVISSLPPAGDDVPLLDQSLKLDPARIKSGSKVYWNCISCHGQDARSMGGAPDLRASVIVTQPDAFEMVVRQGAMRAGGMPQFPELTNEQMIDLRHYLQSEAHNEVLSVKAARP